MRERRNTAPRFRASLPLLEQFCPVQPPATPQAAGRGLSNHDLLPLLSFRLSFQQANLRNGKCFSHYSNGMEITYLAFFFDMEPLISHWLAIPRNFSLLCSSLTSSPLPPSITILIRDASALRERREKGPWFPKRAHPWRERRRSLGPGHCRCHQLSSDLGFLWGHTQVGGRAGLGSGLWPQNRSLCSVLQSITASFQGQLSQAPFALAPVLFRRPHS